MEKNWRTVQCLYSDVEELRCRWLPKCNQFFLVQTYISCKFSWRSNYHTFTWSCSQTDKCQI